MDYRVIINKKLYKGSAGFSGELSFVVPLYNENPQRDYTHEGRCNVIELSCIDLLRVLP